MSGKLKVLLTNDDGIHAQGIQELIKAFSSDYEVFVLAPEDNKSAVSSHIVMNRPLCIKKYSENVYSLDGFPADCVITALRSDLFKNIKFDAVVSGINKGPNMGTDCIYSGTVAAARQAVLYGVPGIALSLKSPDDTYDYQGMADFAAKNLTQLVKLYTENVIVSVNASDACSFKKVKYTSLCIRNYNDKVEMTADNNGNTFASFSGGKIVTFGAEDNEYDAVKNGFVAVSRLLAEPVNYSGSVPEGISFNV